MAAAASGWLVVDRAAEDRPGYEGGRGDHKPLCSR
jgi:hypothetical protein